MVLGQGTCSEVDTAASSRAVSSPSAAAAVCFGRSSNGREAWIHEASGLSYNAFQAQQLASTNPEAALNDP